MTTQPATSSPFAALYFRDFRLYWTGSLISLVGTQMQTAAVAWQIYLLTHSPIALGLIGLVRVLPIIAFSLLGGVVADAHDRRRLLLIAESVLMSASALLALVTFSGTAAAWNIYLLTAIAAAASAFDNPARQALVPSLVPQAVLPNALSLSTTAFEAGAVLGPSASGLIIAAHGVGSVYVIDVISYAAVLVALLLMRSPVLEGAVPRVSLGAAVEGLRFVVRTPIILQTMALDFVATFFGSATALLPIFAQTVLHVGSAGYGLLYAAPSAGAIVAGVILSFYAARIHAKGLVILLAITAYGASTVLFGVSHIFAISLLALAGTGAADTVSMILRQTIRQIATPDALRGRMTSVNMVFFMGGPQLGELEAGVVARALGAPASVIIGGVAVLVSTGIIAAVGERLRAYRL
ncbi:MAG TPA: MFS transporter [Chloroflexota bacterium]|nr:MFS transporter [Chloroflexota bacterium]